MEKKLLVDMSEDELTELLRLKSRNVLYSPKDIQDELYLKRQSKGNSQAIKIAWMMVGISVLSTLASVASAVAAFLALKKP